ncbi:hypothetical protein [Streptomyces sp. DH12]|uniref:hypothetical protein n=1 Tax=Streptomyces sp. DH12 TaxID=2857010 RepID=UPI001E3BF0CC|nr:hypothetical protein [Streptomyces sp. DH12]
MTLIPQPILVNGATHSAQQFRLLVEDLSRGNEGITRGTDMKVTQLGTPGGSVQVASGTGVVRGRFAAFQGTYSVANVGSTTVAIAGTGGTPRSDLLILRIEDPQYEGVLDPAVDAVAYFQVISNVSSTATAIPDGRTGIPLARIDIPASTSTITDAMIVDVRKIANPRRERELLPPQSPTALSALIGASTTYSYFSTAPGWNIAVPSWASTARVRVDGSALRLTTADFYGGFRATLGASLVLQNVTIDDNGGATTRRVQSVSADTLTIPDAYRGTTQLLRAQAAGYSGNAGRIAVDPSSTLIGDIEFIEAPR